MRSSQVKLRSQGFAVDVAASAAASTDVPVLSSHLNCE